MIASLLPKRSKASCLANSVFPTPVGPTNRKLPIGRLPSSKPARFRRIARATISTASSWPITLPFRRLPMPFSRSISDAPSLETGMPVKRSTAAATSFGVATTGFSLFVPSSWCCLSAISFLRLAAFSKSSAFAAASFCALRSLICFSNSTLSTIGCLLAKCAAVISMRSIALSGKERCGIYWIL